MKKWALRFALLLLLLLVLAGYAAYSMASVFGPRAGIAAPPAADWHTAADLFASDAEFRPEIPKTWDDARIESLQLPLARAEASPRQVPADYYYEIPVMPIYKSYPLYLPGREPPGYVEELRSVSPELAWDVRKLETKADWIAAGEEIFRAPILWLPFDGFPIAGRVLLGFSERYVDAAARWVQHFEIPIPTDGTFPYDRISIREKGRLEIGTLSCATCHTRVQEDGSIVVGAQGNYPTQLVFPTAPAFMLRRLMNQLYKAPWLDSDPADAFEKMSTDQMQHIVAQTPPGVMARHGTSPWTPVQVPDLIGVRDRLYLDRTGLVRHRDIGDLMRYAALNQITDVLASYDGYIPIAETRPFEDPPLEPSSLFRYSDAQLYALALYIYSLTPPENPDRDDELAVRGQEIFTRETCDRCHTPPLYTNNKLTPVDGFQIPEGARDELDIYNVRVGTSPELSLQTKRGTGYYKVPSLKGVWYRGPFEHSGSAQTLEDWFDPARLSDDYVPSGFKGVDRPTRSVPGHRFGLDLSEEDRAALIAFLKTL